MLIKRTALYSGGMWLFLDSRAPLGSLERYTFHCFILSLGFLGLIGG
jgi:hypothetical protein